MKRIVLFIAISLFFVGCEPASDEYLQYDLLPVSSVDMPTEFAKDSITEIPVKYIKPTTCHFFYDFYYQKLGLNRTVAIYAATSGNPNCQPDYVTEVEIPLRFKPTELGTYHFKFLIGENPDGTNIFLEHDVVVDH